MTAQGQLWHATGKRKSAVARIWMSPGTGRIMINKRDLETYFGRQTAQMAVNHALELTEQLGKVDIKVTVAGGGIMGQAMAIRHGIARALEKMEPTLRPPLKKAGLLTRDARIKERKKYGQRGARARFQYSKR